MFLYILHVNTSKNKQDNTFCQDLLVFISGLFVVISTFCDENNIEFEMSIMGYCPISRDSEPMKLRHLRRFTCSIYLLDIISLILLVSTLKVLNAALVRVSPM